MKKKLMFILLVLSMLCFVSCGTGSDSILLPAEDITIADINKNIDKYWTGKKVPGTMFGIIKGKYAKTMFEASNREVAEIDAINEYVEEFNKNEENNMTIKRYGDVYQLEDGTKYLAFGGRIKMDRLANRR